MKPLAFAFSQAVIGLTFVAVASPALAGADAGGPSRALSNVEMGVPTEAVALTDSEMESVRGTGIGTGLVAWLGALLSALPSQNTVQAQIGSSPPVTITGDGPQTFALTTSNTTVNLVADNSGTPPSVEVSQIASSSSTRMFVRTFSLGF
jgi:hypothetical protein